MTGSIRLFAALGIALLCSFSCSKQFDDRGGKDIRMSVTVAGDDERFSINGNPCILEIEVTPAEALQDGNVEIIPVDFERNPSPAFDMVLEEDKGDGHFDVSLVFSNEKITSAQVLFLVRTKDAEALSNPVRITRDNLTFKTISLDGQPARLEGDSYVATIPCLTDFSEVELAYETSADFVKVNGEECDGHLVVDLNSPAGITVGKEGVTRSFTLKARNTGLPAVYVDLPPNSIIFSKETWIENARFRIVSPDGDLEYEGTTSIKGRGNNTWTHPKKPYAIKLDQKASLLGMPAHKRWILLANWKDRTLLRNDAAFWLSRQTGLPYTVRGQFVELVMNGKHVGNYYLCEQIRVDGSRVDIDKEDGYLLEIDFYHSVNGDPNCFLSKHYRFDYQVKNPDEDEITDAQMEYIRNYVGEFETILRDKAAVRRHEYQNFLDIDSAIDYILVNEVVGNYDIYERGNSHSVFLWKEDGGVLHFGPVWDFDYRTFVPDYAWEWIGLDKALYYPALMEDPLFQQRLSERWNAVKDKFRLLPAYIDEMVEYLRLSEEVNTRLWPIDNRENGDEHLSYPLAIERMKQGLNSKWEWMDYDLR